MQKKIIKNTQVNDSLKENVSIFFHRTSSKQKKCRYDI